MMRVGDKVKLRTWESLANELGVRRYGYIPTENSEVRINLSPNIYSYFSGEICRLDSYIEPYDLWDIVSPLLNNRHISLPEIAIVPEEVPNEKGN